MKKVKPVKDPEEEILPFSFIKKDISDGKIKAHWQKIKEKIQSEIPKSDDKDDNAIT